MREGDGRNKALFSELMREAHRCDDETLLERARILNAHFGTPMADAEVRAITASVSKITEEGRNRFGQIGSWVPRSEVDALIGTPDALALLNWLKAHNGPDSTFWVADGLGVKLGWTRRQFTNARRYLIDGGWIVPLNRPRLGSPVRYRWIPKHRKTGRQASVL
jgi:hypothetical protein